MPWTEMLSKRIDKDYNYSTKKNKKTMLPTFHSKELTPALS